MSVSFDLSSIPPPQESTRPALELTPAVLTKSAASLVLTSMGLYYLVSGKKLQSVERMVVGAALILGALLLF